MKNVIKTLTLAAKNYGKCILAKQPQITNYITQNENRATYTRQRRMRKQRRKKTKTIGKQRRITSFFNPADTPPD